MSVTVMTTFSEQNYNDYAKYFLASAFAYLKKDITVRLYTDVPYKNLPENYENYILEDVCPNLVAFKNKNKSKPAGKKSFLKDAVRFAHKSYAIIHASKTVNTKRLVWLDADTEILKKLDKSYFQNHLPKGKFVAYLGREKKYTETGYLQFKLNKKHDKFFDKWQWYYDSNEIYNLRGQLDCHVFDKCMEDLKIDGHNLSPNLLKRHFDTTFKNHMCHYKGDDKQNRDYNFSKAKQR
jgi:hypothetical protein